VPDLPRAIYDPVNVPENAPRESPTGFDLVLLIVCRRIVIKTKHGRHEGPKIAIRRCLQRTSDGAGGAQPVSGGLGGFGGASPHLCRLGRTRGANISIDNIGKLAIALNCPLRIYFDRSFNCRNFPGLGGKRQLSHDFILSYVLQMATL